MAVGERGLLVQSGAAARFDPRLTVIGQNGQLQLGVASDLKTWAALMSTTNLSGTVTVHVTPQSQQAVIRAILLPP